MMMKTGLFDKIYTSYFYQIRNFTPSMIPVSTALSDPIWFRPPDGQEYYLDKRGIICGLRYDPLIVQSMGTCDCPCENKQILQGQCPTMREYRQLLETIDFDKMINSFKYCLNKFNKDTIVLIVYETPKNPCSERKALQDYFNSHGIECKELEYPIEEK